MTDDNHKHVHAVTASALWAAAGDALGWITELTSYNGLDARAGVSRVQKPVAWQRIIGGRSSRIKVKFPAGSYSDDTQLRLSVCRATRGNGVFDAEAFAKIELTVWSSYALGGGRGTKAAATNLTRRGVNWFSNFFKSKDQNYFNGGGNGAAMRIQPHVWVCPPDKRRGYLLDVMRDAVVTHGHPHGFGGAAFHALTLGATFGRLTAPGIDDWRRCADNVGELAAVVAEDNQLAAFWLPAWEQETGSKLSDVMRAARDDIHRDLDTIESIIASDDRSAYGEVLSLLGCFKPELRGSGLKTSIAAAALSWLCRDFSPDVALEIAANSLQSDTDTIGTMVGALRGAVSGPPEDWEIQDREYISSEAQRLGLIALGQKADSFAYPDLARWDAPATQSDAVGVINGDQLAVVGLGEAKPMGEEYVDGDVLWQWLRLPYGQTILAKRRRELRKTVLNSELPGERRRPLPAMGADRPISSKDLRLNVSTKASSKLSSRTRRDRSPQAAGDQSLLFTSQFRGEGDLDQLTNWVIEQKFSDYSIGRAFNLVIEKHGSIEAPIALASILAKAKLSRSGR